MNLDEAIQYCRDQGLTERHLVTALRNAGDAAKLRLGYDLVWLVHPVTGGEIQVYRDTVKAYEESGWMRQDTSEPEEK